eukprot:3906108-Rhodomonas_salina.4
MNPCTTRRVCVRWRMLAHNGRRIRENGHCIRRMCPQHTPDSNAREHGTVTKGPENGGAGKWFRGSTCMCNASKPFLSRALERCLEQTAARTKKEGVKKKRISHKKKQRDDTGWSTHVGGFPSSPESKPTPRSLSLSPDASTSSKHCKASSSPAGGWQYPQPAWPTSIPDIAEEVRSRIPGCRWRRKHIMRCASTGGLSLVFASAHARCRPLMTIETGCLLRSVVCV